MSARRAKPGRDVSGNDRCAIYLRISDDREGRELGVTRQNEDCHALAARLNLTVHRVYKDNDISASTRSRKKRPEYAQMLADAWAGKFSVILAYTSGRLTRRPREHEDQIDLAETLGIKFLYVASPSFDLNTAAGRLIARMLAANDTGEPEHNAERVTRQRLQKAEQGEFGGGTRPFGFCLGPSFTEPCPWHGGRDCKAGVTIIESEASEIAKWSHKVLQGVSLRSIAVDLRSRRVPTVTGVAWTSKTVRDILVRPRNAGLVVYRDEILEGVAAMWKPIVPREIWEAVCEKLSDPNRRTVPPGTAPRWLGSGGYRCGICTPLGTDTDKPMTCQVTLGGREPRYRCKDRSHLTRNVAHTDRVVLAHVMYVLTHPRAFELLSSPAPDVDVDALRAERAAIDSRLEQMAQDEVLGLKKRSQVIAATQVGNQRIEEIDQLLSTTISNDPLSDLINSADPVKSWAALGLGSKQVIINRLCTVTILPCGRVVIQRVEGAPGLGCPLILCLSRVMASKAPRWWRAAHPSGAAIGLRRW
jgi:site-specific DNA recombinase